MKPESKFFQIFLWPAVAVVLLTCHVVAAKEPLYEGLVSYSRKIMTDSPEGD